MGGVGQRCSTHSAHALSHAASLLGPCANRVTLSCALREGSAVLSSSLLTLPSLIVCLLISPLFPPFPPSFVTQPQLVDFHVDPYGLNRQAIMHQGGEGLLGPSDFDVLNILPKMVTMRPNLMAAASHTVGGLLGDWSGWVGGWGRMGWAEVGRARMEGMK